MTAFTTHLADAFRRFGPIETRRMFSGAGVYHQGVMFGLVVDEVLYLKVDDANRAAFTERGLGPFEYTRLGRRVQIGSFHQAPEEVLEDAVAAATWARPAYEAALRAQKKKPARKPAKRDRMERYPAGWGSDADDTASAVCCVVRNTVQLS